MSFFSQFHVIIAGLDNVDARRWMNSTIHRMVPFNEMNEPEVATVLIDGGTEGF
jgi:ubiquitin-activating enzyme E1 C